MQQREMFSVGTSASTQMLLNVFGRFIVYSPIPHTAENSHGQTSWPKGREEYEQILIY